MESIWIIVCPKCNSDSGIILEQPHWDSGVEKLAVNIQANCVSCEIDFDVTCNLINPIISNIKKNKYTY